MEKLTRDEFFELGNDNETLGNVAIGAVSQTTAYMKGHWFSSVLGESGT